jgi:hypothetical protein
MVSGWRRRPTTICDDGDGARHNRSLELKAPEGIRVEAFRMHLVLIGLGGVRKPTCTQRASSGSQKTYRS